MDNDYSSDEYYSEQEDYRTWRNHKRYNDRYEPLDLLANGIESNTTTLKDVIAGLRHAGIRILQHYEPRKSPKFPIPLNEARLKPRQSPRI